MAGRGEGWLVPHGLTSMSGVFSGMSGPPFLHVLSPPQGRWLGFSHQSAVFQEGDSESHLLNLRLGSPAVLQLPWHVGHRELQGNLDARGRNKTAFSQEIQVICGHVGCAINVNMHHHPLFGSGRFYGTYFHQQMPWCVPFSCPWLCIC